MGTDNYNLRDTVNKGKYIKQLFSKTIARIPDLYLQCQPKLNQLNHSYYEQEK